MRLPRAVFRIVDPCVAALLRSPLHGLASGRLLLLEYTGRRSGRALRTPVSYSRTGEGVRAFGRGEARWWRNLQGGADVHVWLGGQRTPARARTVAEPARVAQALEAHLAEAPGDAAYHGLPRDGADAAAVAEAARGAVLVEIEVAPRSE